MLLCRKKKKKMLQTGSLYVSQWRFCQFRDVCAAKIANEANLGREQCSRVLTLHRWCCMRSMGHVNDLHFETSKLREELSSALKVRHLPKRAKNFLLVGLAYGAFCLFSSKHRRKLLIAHRSPLVLDLIACSLCRTCLITPRYPPMRVYSLGSFSPRLFSH